MKLRFNVLAFIYTTCTISVYLLLVPSIADFYTQSKWLGFYIFSVAAGLVLYFRQNIFIWQNGYLEKIAVGIGCLWALSLIRNIYTVNTLLALRILGSFILILFYIQFFQIKNWFRIFLLSSGFACSVALLVQNWAFLKNSSLDGFFGHINMSAEISGLLVLISILVFFSISHFWLRALFSILGINAFIWIWYQHTRAVYVALLLAAFYLLATLYYQRLSKHLKLILVFGIFIIIPIFILPNLHISSHPWLERLSLSSNEGKVQTAQNRWTRWGNTLFLIKENPLGLGFQSFEFAYLPYREAVHPDVEISEANVSFSPHNSFLDLAAEHGVFVAISLFSIFIFLICKKPTVLIHSKEITGIKTVFIYILGLGLTAFPFELAWSYNLGLFCVAILIAANIPLRVLSLNQFHRIGIGGICMIIFMFTVAFGFAQFAEKNYTQQSEFNNLACEVFPSQWRVCLNHVQNSLDQNKNDLAEERAQAVLDRQPFNYIALRLRANALQGLDRSLEACDLMNKYSALWGPENSQRAFQQAICKK